MAALSVVVPLGPNPAALTELLWRLIRDGETVGAVHVVLDSPRARYYWEREAVPAYTELRAACPGLPEPAALDVVDVFAPEDRSAAFGEAMHAALRRAQSESPAVVVALSGGRWRGSTALTTTVFQLLARPGDRLVDVRVSERGAEGATGFFFPEQQRQVLHRLGRKQARDVRVLLDAMPVPRLRPFLDEADLDSFAQALDASRAALAAAEPPRVELDLLAGELRVAGRPVKLSISVFPLYAWVAVGTRDKGGVPSGDIEGLRAFLEAWRAAAPMPGNVLVAQERKDMVSKLLSGVQLTAEDLSPWLSRSRGSISKRLADAAVPRRDLVEISHVHAHDGEAKYTRLHLRLPPSHITLTGGWQP